MDIINPSFLSTLFNNTRKKLFSNFTQNESKESSTEKIKEKKKEKKLILFNYFKIQKTLKTLVNHLQKK